MYVDESRAIVSYVSQRFQALPVVWKEVLVAHQLQRLQQISQMSFTTLIRSLFHLNESNKTVLLASLVTGVPAVLGIVEARSIAYTATAFTFASYLVLCVIFPLLRRWVLAGRRSRSNRFSRWSTFSMALKFGGNLFALRFVERYIDDPADAMNTLSILETMTYTDKHILKVVAEMGGIETAVKALKKYSEESEGVAWKGCGLLRNVCGYNADFDEKVLECGGITALVQAMTHWPDNEQVQTFACTALDRLASSSDEAVRKKIIDVGGLVALAQARTKHQNDVRVRLPADHALIELVQQNKP